MKIQIRFFSILSLAVMLALTAITAAPVQPAYASALVVNATDDIDDGVCNVSHCSLREAMNTANGNGVDDTVTFSVSGTIYLASILPTVSGDGNLTVDGGNNIILNGDTDNNGTGDVKMFHIINGANLLLQNISLIKGLNTLDSGGAIENYGHLTIQNSTLSDNKTTTASSVGGGAVYNGGGGATLTIIDSTLSGNIATYFGGGVYNSGGTVTISNSTFSGNQSTASHGGAIFNSGGTLTINGAVFSVNTAFDNGGAIFTQSGINPVSITDSTFSNNQADFAGGISIGSGTVSIYESTFSNNIASNDAGGVYVSGGGSVNVTNGTFSGNASTTSRGGAIFSFGSVDLTNVTMTGNMASSGQAGGIQIYNNVLTLKNTLIANSGDGGECILAGTSSIGAGSSNNLLEDGSSACGLTNGGNGNIVGQDPLLGVLANNGGPTQTFALLAGSPAIDAGTSAGCPATDQRGVIRPLDGDNSGVSICDIGAYELSSPSPIFTDVPLSYSVITYIERLYNAGITGGCSLTPLMYCPENTVTRAQMAVFLLRGIHGSSYVPPAVGDSTGFADVPTNHPVAAWIKQLAAEGITGGCSGGNYCPDATVTRAQMAVFLLRSKYTSAYTPPPANGDFTDVPLDHLMVAWIEQLAAEGITGGCGAGVYCPDGNVTRAQMAVFLVRTFNLP